MCMDRISEKKPAPEGVGYKAFEKRGRKLYGEFTGKETPRPVGKWLRATNCRPTARERGVMSKLSYPPGWHIFKLRKGVKNWMGNYNSPYHATRKVKYRLAHTKGLMWESGVIVAEEIYIIP